MKNFQITRMVKTMEIMERLSNAASSASLSDVGKDYLEHHGIIGMKWGVRRFQPYPKGYHGDGKYVGKDVKPKTSDKDSEVGSPQSDHKKEIKEAELKTRHQNKVRMEVTRAIEEGDKKRLRKVADKMTTDEYVENLNKLVSKGVTEATNKGDPDQLRKYKKDLTPKEYENAKNLAKFNKAINELDVKAMNSLMSKISTEDLQKGAERLKTINDMQEKKLKAISRESEVTATLQRISKFTKVVSDLSTHAKTIKSNVEEIKKSENNSYTNNQEPKKKEEEKKKDTAKHSDILISDLMSQDYLEHHGIIGQKWGKRHGPPYPLSGKVSAAVKRGDNPKTKSSGTVYGDAKKKTTTKSRVKKAKVDHFKEDDPDEEKYRKSQAVGSMVMSTLGLAAGVAINAAMISSGVINPVALVMPLASSIGIVAAAKELHDASKANKLVEKLNKERAANTKIDKKTGLKLKQQEMTREEDLKRVNPGYKNFQPNTKSNCMLCTTTYDIRRRGYDVTAQKAAVGYGDDDIKKWYKNAKVKQVQSTGPASLIRNTKQELVAQGEGARGNLMVQWSGANSGHSMAYEIHDGKVVIYDAQSNEVIKNPDKILSMSRAASYVRLDNLQPNWKEIKKECVM